MTFFELASNAAVMAQGYKFSQIAMNVTKLADPTAASITLVALTTANQIAEAMLNDL